MTSKKSAAAATSMLTGAEVREMIGNLDDAIILGILETGANSEQVLEAFMRVSGNTSLGEDLEKPADTTVLQIMEILTRDEETNEDR